MNNLLASAGWVRFSAKERTLFAKRLAFLLRAGVPLVEALHLIRSQTSSVGKGRVYDEVIHDVKEGQYLATSLAKHARLFGEFSINLIRVGETSGVLSQNLSYLSDELQKHHDLIRKVRAAMVYPVFITLSTLGVTATLTAFIFPKLMPIFTSLHVDLPLTTRMLIAAADYLAKWGITTVLVLALGVVAFFAVRNKSERMRYRTDRALLRVPIMGALARAYNLANFSRTLGLLLKSGLSLMDAIVTVGQTTHNRAYRAASKEMSDAVLRGEPVSRALAARPELFPDMFVHMVAIGESTGNLSGSLIYMSEGYESEVDELTKGLSSAIEPVLLIVMGLLVGLIAVSVITPIYSITQYLTPH